MAAAFRPIFCMKAGRTGFIGMLSCWRKVTLDHWLDYESLTEAPDRLSKKFGGLLLGCLDR